MHVAHEKSCAALLQNLRDCPRRQGDHRRSGGERLHGDQISGGCQARGRCSVTSTGRSVAVDTGESRCRACAPGTPEISRVQHRSSPGSLLHLSPNLCRQNASRHKHSHQPQSLSLWKRSTRAVVACSSFGWERAHRPSLDHPHPGEKHPSRSHSVRHDKTLPGPPVLSSARAESPQRRRMRRRHDPGVLLRRDA